MDQLNQCSELVDGGQPDEGPYQTPTPAVTGQVRFLTHLSTETALLKVFNECMSAQTQTVEKSKSY